MQHPLLYEIPSLEHIERDNPIRASETGSHAALSHLVTTRGEGHRSGRRVTSVTVLVQRAFGESASL